MLLLLLLRWLLVNGCRLHKGDQFLETWRERANLITYHVSGVRAQRLLGEIPQDDDPYEQKGTRDENWFHSFLPWSEF